MYIGLDNLETRVDRGRFNNFRTYGLTEQKRHIKTFGLRRVFRSIGVVHKEAVIKFQTSVRPW